MVRFIIPNQRITESCLVETRKRLWRIQQDKFRGRGHKEKAIESGREMRDERVNINWRRRERKKSKKGRRIRRGVIEKEEENE